MIVVRRVLIVLCIGALGCLLFLSPPARAGKKVLIKIHVPKVIKHKHHTNIVFVHKHHHHPKPHQHHHHHHHKDHGGHFHYNHHDHSSPGHDGHHHSHSYGHHHHYSFGHGDGDHGHKHHHHHHHSSHGGGGGGAAGAGGGGGHKKKKEPKMPPKPKAPAGTDHKKQSYEDPSLGTPNYFDDVDNFYIPKTKTQQYRYETITPTQQLNLNNRLKEENQTIRHEAIKYQTLGPTNPPETEDAFQGFSYPQIKNSYEVQENYPFDYNFEPKQTSYKEDYEKYREGVHGSFENYGEDYTNPNSVARYTSAIQHGAIGLEDTNYNPGNGNNLEQYINGYSDPDEDT